MSVRVLVRCVFALAIVFGATASSCGKNAKAFTRSSDDAFRVTSQLVDDAPPQMQSHLDDVTLRSGFTPSPALESRGVTFTAAIDGVSADAVAASATFGRLNGLIERHGDQAYEWTCEVIDAITFLVDNGWSPSLTAVNEELQQRMGHRPDVPVEEIYNVVTDMGDAQADEAAQILLWTSCLGAG